MNGYLIVEVYADNIALPIEDAKVTINDDVYYTDESGQTKKISLITKNMDSSNFQNEVNNESYNISVEKDGFTSEINNILIYPDIIAYQKVFFNFLNNSVENLPDNQLMINEPKIIENEIKDIKNTKVLPEVIAPEYIIVHDGSPTDTSATNYYVPFTDYIKNVASSEIYSTWPTECLKANIIAIISFTLNRVYTEWYISKGYSFTITSLPAYDQKYSVNGTTYSSINTIVDEIFLQYITFNNLTQPFFAQYNDGITTNNSGWLSQWGSKELADKGYDYKEILKYYYTSNIQFKEAIPIFGYPTSYPGYTLKYGDCSSEVQKIQIELNIIRQSYPKIPLISNANGYFDDETLDSVKVFQSVFGIVQSGNIDFTTWYRISYIYMAVKEMTAGIYS